MMPLRDEWKFRYTCSDLIAPTEAKAKHHRERETFWTGELEKAKEKVRSGGAVVREHPISGGTRMQVMIDPEVQGRANECAEKVRSHRESAEEYERWLRVFRGNGDASVELDAKDVEFFGL
jgi:hypothetical protein